MPPARPPRRPAAGRQAETELIAALLSLHDTDEMRRFLGDLCTPQEIADLADRWAIARLLDEGAHSYRALHDLTGVSVTTIGRVARFLSQENYQGYRLALDRLRGKAAG